jgi:hypothetical protein
VAIPSEKEAPLFVLYVHDLLWLTDNIVRGCASVFSETPSDKKYISVSPVIHAQIAGVLGDAAKVGRLVFPSEQRSSKEGRRAFAMKLARAEALQEMLAGLDLTQIRDTTARNSIEHFDERLDAANAAGQRAARGTMAAYNLILSHREIFTTPLLPIRVYIAVERRFLNLKWSADLGKLHTEATSVLDRLRALVPRLKEPGGLMIHLG